MSEKQGRKRGSPKGAIDFPKSGTGLPVATAPQGGISATVKSTDTLVGQGGISATVKSTDTLVGAVLEHPQHEQYAQAVAAGCSYAEAYRRAGYAHDTSNAHKVAYLPAVAARIRMLRTAAAEHTVQSIAARMDLLDSIVHADPSELTRVVVQPCGTCWTDEALADAMGRALAGKAATPNTDAPRPDCAWCKGDGISRVVLTPTAELSAGARALFKAARQNAKGEIVVETHDRIAAINALNAMQPGALAASRSLNMNLNSFIPAAREGQYSIDELNRLMAAFDDDKVVAEG